MLTVFMIKKLCVFKNIDIVKYASVLIGLISIVVFNSPEENSRAPCNLSEKIDGLRKIVTIESRTLISAVSVSTKVLFNHPSFKDFSKGALSDYGANLYVSQKGNI